MTMKGLPYNFLILLAMAVLAYVSVYLWFSYQAAESEFNKIHNVTNNATGTVLGTRHLETDRHTKMWQKKDEIKEDVNTQKVAKTKTGFTTRKEAKNETGFTTRKEAKNETGVNGTMSSSAVSLRDSPPSRVAPQKYLIYVCHRRPYCGGWSDRQRGLISVFMAALVTDRRFGIIMDNPCNVTHFYEPVGVNWNIPAAELINKTSIEINDMGSKAGVSNVLRTEDFNERYPQDVVYIKTNSNGYPGAISHSERYAKKMPDWAKSKSGAVLFANIWKRMMRPSPFLQHRLNDYLRSIGYEKRTQPLLCCHVRVARSETIKNDGPSRLNVSDVTILWKFFRPYVQNGSKVFVATDNYEVRNSSRQWFGRNASDSGGNIIHIDRHRGGRDDACGGFGFAVLDQLILSKCDLLVVTNSGFGMRAAFIRGKSENLFRFTKKQVKQIKLR
ncbi:uncharacterized protein LOC143298553 isoform X1 [Babylonia areolata]|uniref:uncharacterized protein LOC143298553 isoform X1 n=3 Tax=Babylonia areolata TaxID=304850 RepID=UPI003FD10F13